MSMLAEKRQKKTWILNPKTTAWTEDANKFGQRMLEKMGWTPGKGLGANEQGMVNALRIKYKSDLRGLGCEHQVEEWIKSQEEYNTLLGQLWSGENHKEVGKKSLEKTSKNIRSRVHYHKFTRGKDLSRYSTKDLESILGVNCNAPNAEELNTDALNNCDSTKKKSVIDFNNDVLNFNEAEEHYSYMFNEECNKLKSKNKYSKHHKRKLSDNLLQKVYQEDENCDKFAKIKKKKKANDCN